MGILFLKNGKIWERSNGCRKNKYRRVREKALEIGANVVMPNITPTTNRTLYKLYENKPGTHEGAAESMRKLEESIFKSGCKVAYGTWGDSRHFQSRTEN